MTELIRQHNRTSRIAILSQNCADIFTTLCLQNELTKEGHKVTIIVSTNQHKCTGFWRDRAKYLPYFGQLAIPKTIKQVIAFFTSASSNRSLKYNKSDLFQFDVLYYFDATFDWSGIYYIHLAEKMGIQCIRLNFQPYQTIENKKLTSKGFKKLLMAYLLTGVVFQKFKIPESGYDNIIGRNFDHESLNYRSGNDIQIEVIENYSTKIKCRNNDFLWIDMPLYGEIKFMDFYVQLLNELKQRNFHLIVKLHPGFENDCLSILQNGHNITFLHSDIPGELIEFDNICYVGGISSTLLPQFTSKTKSTKVLSFLLNFFSEDQLSYKYEKGLMDSLCENDINYLTVDQLSAHIKNN